MDDDKEFRISFHCVGRKIDGSGVFIQRLNEQKIWHIDDFETQATLRFICAKADSEFVGAICVQQEGDKLQPHLRYWHYPPSPEDEAAMNAATLRVMCSGTGFIDEKDGAERSIDNFKFLEGELGMKFGGDSE